MAFSPEQKQRVLAAVMKVVPNPGKCTVCGNPTWILGDGFVFLFLQDAGKNVVQLGGPMLPSVPLLCTVCGHTVLLNAMMMGLRDMVESKAT